MREMLAEKSGEFRELARMARQDYLDRALSRVSAHDVMDKMGRSWSVCPIVEHDRISDSKSGPFPPIDRARFTNYLTRIASISVSCIVTSERSTVLQADLPSFSNDWVAKSYFVGNLSSLESILPFEARWPTREELSAPRARHMAYKKLDKDWYIELRYFDGFL